MIEIFDDAMAAVQWIDAPARPSASHVARGWTLSMQRGLAAGRVAVAFFERRFVRKDKTWRPRKQPRFTTHWVEGEGEVDLATGRFFPAEEAGEALSLHTMLTYEQMAARLVPVACDWWAGTRDAGVMLAFAEKMLPAPHAVWLAAQVARTTLPWVPPGEDRPLRAIEAAEAWSRGEVSSDLVRVAADKAADYDSRSAAYCIAAYVANPRAAYNITHIPFYAVQTAQRAAHPGATIVDVSASAWRAEEEQRVADLANLVRSLQPCPLVSIAGGS